MIAPAPTVGAGVVAGRAVNRALSVLFVVVWSTGFVAGSIGLRYMGPLTVNFFRFGLAAVAVLAAALAARVVWPRDVPTALRVAAPGVLVQAVHQSAIYFGLAHGVPPGLAALIIGVNPVLTSLLAMPFLGERFRPVQAVGLLVGMVGVITAMWTRLGNGADLVGYGAAVLALFSLSFGTVLQKRFSPDYDLRVVNALQLTCATAVLAPAAFLLEGFAVRDDSLLPVLGSVGWLGLINAVGGVSLLYVLLRRGAAGTTSSVFYLVPATTAVFAWVVLGIAITGNVILGLVISAIGMFVATRPDASDNPNASDNPKSSARRQR